MQLNFSRELNENECMGREFKVYSNAPLSAG